MLLCGPGTVGMHGLHQTWSSPGFLEIRLHPFGQIQTGNLVGQQYQPLKPQILLGNNLVLPPPALQNRSKIVYFLFTLSSSLFFYSSINTSAEYSTSWPTTSLPLIFGTTAVWYWVHTCWRNGALLFPNSLFIFSARPSGVVSFKIFAFIFFHVLP